MTDTDIRHRSSAEYYTDELAPVLSGSPGPLEAFKLTPERDGALKAQAIATGVIPRGAFGYMAIFDESEVSLARQKRRREVKVGSEVLRILTERDEELGTGDARDQAVRIAAGLHARQQTNHAVVVEAARKLRIEAAEGELDPRNGAIYAGELDRAQSELYPDVDPVVSNGILAHLASELRDVDTSVLPADQRGFIDDFSDKYPVAVQEREAHVLAELSDERVAEFQEKLHRRYKPALDKVRAEIGELTVERLTEAMNIFMREIGLPMAADIDDHAGWLCDEDDSFTGFKTSPSSRRITRGRFSKITWERFDELALHEGVVHAERSENGAATDVEAMRTGLTGNSSFEEGLGLLMEQLFRGKVDQGLSRDDFRYLTIAYADGHVDGQPHDETDSVRFISSFMAASGVADGSPKPIADILKSKRSLAYDHVKRAFRGMPPGKTLHSNLSYKQGKIDVISFIASSEASAAEILDYLLQAKFNPLDPEHKPVLAALGMKAEVQ